jgi:hypothetical protein
MLIPLLVPWMTHNTGAIPDAADAQLERVFRVSFEVEQNADSDRKKVSELQDEAIATDLGMKPLLDRVLAQREILKA